MLVLALDTCDSRGSVALLQANHLLQLEVHDSLEDYSSWLIGAVQRLLDRQKVDFADTALHAVASGPGSFTGVRIGLTTVKAWSEVYGKPIAAISRLGTLSTYSSRRLPLTAVFTDAQRGQLFGALYRQTQNATERLDEERVIPPDDFMNWAVAAAAGQRIEWISPDPKCLTTSPQWPSRIGLGETIRVVAPVLAPAVGRLGLRAAEEGCLTDALSLDANYVRRSDAELFWKGASRASGS